MCVQRYTLDGCLFFIYKNLSLLDGFFSLGARDNKVDPSSNNEDGAVSDLLPELTLEMEDDELIALKKSWEQRWEPYEKEVAAIQTENENYWLGKQFTAAGERPLVDNLIFESLETFLPIATRAKAEVLVESDNTDEGNALADKVRKMATYVADKNTLNLKMKQVARYWALYLLGAMKMGWSEVQNDITFNAIRPQKLILDPDATIEGCEYMGYYIGERVQDTASNLVLRFPKKKDFILDKVKQKTGTTVTYIQWWTNDYLFYSLDDEVLDKTKNPHWNYDTKEQILAMDPMTGAQIPQEQDVPGNNHFNAPAMPYIFLSVFNLGRHPHDDTNLIKQNLALQDLINKRLLQIDCNADNANNGIALSGDAFTQEQAMSFGKTRRKGGIAWVPTGDVNSAIKELPGTPLPNFIYESLIDYRNEVRNIFGTRGSTPQGTIGEDTVGGKKIISGQDTDRIGGGISTYLEQFSDKVFNWIVQLMYVYYDEPHSAAIVGTEKAKEYITLVNTEFTSKLLIGVKEGSMVPHDPANQRNEAVELWKDEGIDPITFFDRLEFPNPRESAKQLYLWKADPIQLFPDLLQQQQEQQMMMQQQDQAMQDEQMAAAQEEEVNRAEQDHERELEKMEFQSLVKQP